MINVMVLYCIIGRYEGTDIVVRIVSDYYEAREICTDMNALMTDYAVYTIEPVDVFRESLREALIKRGYNVSGGQAYIT